MLKTVFWMKMVKSLDLSVKSELFGCFDIFWWIKVEIVVKIRVWGLDIGIRYRVLFWVQVSGIEY